MSATPTAPALSLEARLYLFHHVFLPPKLPQSDDYDASCELILLDSVINSLQKFRALVPNQHRQVLGPVITMVARLREIRGSHGDVSEGKLKEALQKLDTEGGVLPVHVRCQNAAVLMTRNDNAIHVEAFELSPQNEAVNSTVGRLQRQFPGPSFMLDRATFNAPGLQNTIAQTLATMSHQSVAGTKPKVKKARQKHDEDRDTTNPKMVTEFLAAFLRPCAAMFDGLQIHKNTREEVLWLDSRFPWRRSPLWLLVRVALQVILRRLCRRDGISDDIYKHYMVYYMSSVLNDCLKKTMSDEQLYLMNAKIARRLHKLDLSHLPAWFPFVKNVLQEVNASILKSWRGIMAQSGPRHDKDRLAKLNFGKDIYCSLPDLDKWLEALDKREHCSSSADFQPRTGLLEFEKTELPLCLKTSDPDYKLLNLAAFEDWVRFNLDTWLEVHLSGEDTCQQLGNLIKHYYGVASPLYSRNPEAISVMLLTILELWIACDKSAFNIHPLLGDYDNCIPMDMFESLVLPYRSQMERLARAEDYMNQRRQRLRFPESFIFQDFGTRSCFSVRSFDRSIEHQNLLSEIEDLARSERTQKRLELGKKHQRYRELYALADQLECTYYKVIPDPRFDLTESRHCPNCQRCAYKTEAESIKINIHEWPLPTDPLHAKTTVFELNVPRPFASWRDTTIFFLLTVLRLAYFPKEQPRARNRLQTYSGLSPFFTPTNNSQRVGLLSQDKPHETTHRRSKSIIDVTEKDVCLENGLNFCYFDQETNCFVTRFKTTDETASSCTYKVPRSSSNLQKFLFRPAYSRNGPSPNTVIASQDICPHDMSLEEYKALCSMPLGVEIQWQNILRQLAMPSVVFKKVETCIFILQIIHQAGPPTKDSVLRAGHVILDDDLFATVLLAEIANAAGRIEENWESAQELSALIFLTQRVLSVSTSTRVRDLCLAQLSTLRTTSFKWATLVREQASYSDTDAHRNDLIARSTSLALICASTFDIESPVLEKILEIERNASVWIQCCMMIHDRKGLLDMTPGCLLQILYYRWQIVSYRSYRVLAFNVVHNQKLAIDLAIKEAWAAYHSDSPWSVAPGGGNHWLVTGNRSLLVHFNLLTAELLINGRPLARLPSEYESHKTYRTLFGQSPVDVMPSELPGMQFSVQRKHMGQTIHLGKKSITGSQNFDICVRAFSKEHRVREFVPVRLLTGAFPDAFVEDYAHWYDLDGGYVEFCPVKDPWQASSAHWRLQRKHPGQNGWCLVKGEISLVNIKSQTAGSLFSILQPIERASRLHYKFHTSSSALEIDIPRLRLSFSLQSGHSWIRSRQYRGMKIDPDQSLGTLVGLRSKLILLHENDHSRKVLIPDGAVTWVKDGGHVGVNIGWQAVSKLHVYSVDNQLGRLVDNGSLQSKLMLCYLHAVTSFCVPDVLTKKTGTEQSLSILRSASMRSFNQLTPENISILVELARLTPVRKYYPANERVMQSVKWQNLGCLVHHDDFREQVQAIIDQDSRMRMFYPHSQWNQPILPVSDKILLQRDRIRSSSFRTSGFGAEGHTSTFDDPYTERGRNHQSEGFSRVFTLCKTIHEGTLHSARTITDQDLLSDIWCFLCLPEAVHGPAMVVEKAKVKYDATWLLDPVDFVSAHWCGIHQLLGSGTTRPNKHQVMIWLSALAFSDKIPMAVLETFAAFYVIPTMTAYRPPSRPSFQLTKGYELNKNVLKSQIQSVMRDQTPESSELPNPGETYRAFKSRIKCKELRNREQALNNFIAGLCTQWPTSTPSAPNSQGSPRFEDYYNSQKAMAIVRQSFSEWYDNGELRGYLTRVASVLSGQPLQIVAVPSPPFSTPAQPSLRKRRFISIDNVLDQSLGAPPVLATESPGLGDLLYASPTSAEPALRVLPLVMALGLQASSDYESQYVEKLRDSTKSLQEQRHADQITLHRYELENVICDYLLRCETHSREIYDAILARMTLSSPDQESLVHHATLKILTNINMAPRFSPELFLQQLTRKRWSQLPMGWKACFVTYGLSITALQRAKRLVSLVDHREELVRELQNPGHSNWDPYEFPESLLLEIENGLLIRDVQEQIARQMRNIQPRQNAVMQLNMGEGKSSVIVPIVAAALADGSCLVRVLVAKPQSRQMLQMLVSKLGGLLGRRVYHLPVSRSLRISEREASEMEHMCLECMEDGGVLLVQPEHILSLKLMCLECFVTGREAVGRCLLRTLELFRTSSRDVVDESDENFSVKFELIYTMGSQRALELSPQRWTLIQQLLGLVRRYAPALKSKFPQSIEIYEQRPGGFPRIRLLHKKAALELFKLVADHICNNGIDSLPISRQPEATRRAILSYFLNLDLSAQEIAAVEDDSATSFWTASTKDPLLLLRGLLACGVLDYCLSQKRWRVNYGPDDSRNPPTRLSVPYRAKDNPAPQSEFSHPDVVVVLTCLSYYYAGLSDDDLVAAFHHLLKSDQADTEYQAWIDDAPDLSYAYRQLGGINLQDRHHCIEHVFPNLQFSKGAIDYFLSHLVFPKEMKEFPNKLSASGWDIGEIKTSNCRLQWNERFPGHASLKLRNSRLAKSDAEALLDLVVSLDPPTQVVLDVGAQILELTNLEVAKTWLRMVPDEGRAQAVVYVSDGDEICVVDRTGLVEPLQISPFAKQLGACLVFLDEAHTRGIDLKLPQHYRAAVTLGAGITKDKLVQACMRMRKLGKGQSVVFCVPQEIRSKILSIIGKPSGYDIDVSEVLRWAVSETWADMQRSIPLWAIQGERFERQNNLWSKARRGGEIQMSKNQAEEFLEQESQSLEQRYRPCPDNNAPPFITSDNDDNDNIRLILERCREFENINFKSTQLQEEQERQLAPEVEQERQVQRPPSATPEDHSVHPDLRRFVTTGILKDGSSAVMPAFQGLDNTSAAKHLNVSEFPPGLLVTSDFARTVKVPKLPSSTMDGYQRPVQWVITGTAHSFAGRNRKVVKHMIVISPYEANELLSAILKSKKITMHMYAPRQNRIFSALDNLGLYPIPRADSVVFDIPTTLRIQLNLFAGQLYISSFDEYREICEFLGVAYYAAPEGLTVAADGFIVAPDRAIFTKSPLKFLKVLMSQIRKDGQEIDKTHIGKLLDGKLLTMDDFEDGDN
ncbi:hypothetical protein DTO195F2_5534 [Paecilomyces variotii]|nr:hypothetical protein DTO195F2_5534 [Paecilomyces variotii]KAJ9374734.1 hypothetical protein DTO282E5_817 [Paecilomyces variotii]KAJ9398684.1 hypothetical protein DTO282F9_4500 [Paecilomyces variotii]